MNVLVAAGGSVAATTLGLTLTVAAISKLRDVRGFGLDVLEYQVLPPALALWYARLLPPVELFCGIGLIVGFWRPVVGVLAALVLASFLIAVSINLARGRALDCHCFGSQSSEPLGGVTIGRLVALLGCATVVVASASEIASPSLSTTFIGVGLALGIYLAGTVPTVARLFQGRGVPAPTRHGARVSLRNLPLVPIAAALADRSGEISRCGACP